MAIELGVCCFPGEPEYILPAADGEEECQATHAHTYYCTRAFGHEGDHVAHGMQNQMVAVWSRNEY